MLCFYSSDEKIRTLITLSWIMMKGNDSNLCFSLYIRLHRIFTPFSARDTNMMCGAYEFFAKCQKNHALLLPKGRRAKNILGSGWLRYHAREADAQANDDWSQSHFTRAHTHTHTHIIVLMKCWGYVHVHCSMVCVLKQAAHGLIMCHLWILKRKVDPSFANCKPYWYIYCAKFLWFL